MARTTVRSVSKRYSPQSAAVQDAPLQPRMRELYEAALACKGSVDLMLEKLGVPITVLAQRLSILRASGVAKLVTLEDPTARGVQEQSTVWVRMAHAEPGMLEGFERDLVADPAVAGAQRLIGDYDYRLSTFHPSWREAALWARAMNLRPEVHEIKVVSVKPLFGDDLPGVALHRGRRRGSGRA